MGASLIVDEAHSLGILGANGRGLCEAAGVEADVDFVVGTFSKSFGAIGGFATSNLPEFDVLRVVCRPYMFTASLPPAVIASVIAALRRLSTDKSLAAQVLSNSRRLYSGLARAGFDLGPEPNPIVAVKMPDRATATLFWNRLLDEGIYVNLALPPATPASLSLIRSSISSAHTEAQIDRAVSVMTAVGRELGVLGKHPGRAAWAAR
jgi:8-amino-7-oxononanoate synthase